MTLGPNEALIGAADFERELATPALLLDLAAFEANLKTMADFVARSGPQAAPARQGAQVGRRSGAGRSRRSGRPVLRDRARSRNHGRCGARRHSRDDAGRHAEHDRAARRGTSRGSPTSLWRSTARPVSTRSPVSPGASGRSASSSTSTWGRPEPASPIPQRPCAWRGTPPRSPSLRFRGVQAYYGHLQHVPTFAERLEKVRERWSRLATFTEALRASGLAARDRLGRRHRNAPSRHRAGAVHRNPGGVLPVHGQAIRRRRAGAGRLAVLPPRSPSPDAWSAPSSPTASSSTPASRPWRPMPGRRSSPRAHPSMRPISSWATSTARCASPTARRRPALGDLVTLVAPHCDPTVNLHNWLHVVEDGRLVDIWPIEARGY